MARPFLCSQIQLYNFFIVDLEFKQIPTFCTYKEVNGYSDRSFKKEVAICRRLNCCLDPSRHRIDVNGPEIVPVTASTISFNNGLYSKLIKVHGLVLRTVLKRAI